MAFFSNGSAGEIFDMQCMKCKYGEAPCPIALVQHTFNYDAHKNKTATAILDTLVQQDGSCTMWKAFEKDFFKDTNQMKLF